jgi:hypothetical protein
MLKVAYDTNKVVLQKLVLQKVHQIGESVKRRRDELRKFMESIGATNGHVRDDWAQVAKPPSMLAA